MKVWVVKGEEHCCGEVDWIVDSIWSTEQSATARGEKLMAGRFHMFRYHDYEVDEFELDKEYGE